MKKYIGVYVLSSFINSISIFLYSLTLHIQDFVYISEMYGLILEGIGDAVRRKFGDQIWEETRKKAGVPHHSFNMHKTYSETVIPRLAKAGSEVG